MKKRILQSFLKFFAEIVLLIHKPKIIAITGTVGKTSAKEAISWVLAQGHIKIGKTYANLNNQFGVPLSVLGVREQPRDLREWLGVGWSALKSIFTLSYPKYLVLELAIDRPDDMDFFLSFIKPHIVVITALGKTHAEYFKSISDLWNEKLKLVAALPKDGVVLVNADLASREMVCALAPRCIAYGSVSGDELSSTLGLPDLPKPQQEALLAAKFVAKQIGLSYEDIDKGLKTWQPPAKRLEKIMLDDFLVIDDSYNASPQSMRAALEFLTSLPGRHIAVLGDMRELGEDEVFEHRKVGQNLEKVDHLITVGANASYIGQEAVNRGKIKADRWHQAATADEAFEIVTSLLSKGDVVLVKGSLATGMGIIVEKLKTL